MPNCKGPPLFPTSCAQSALSARYTDTEVIPHICATEKQRIRQSFPSSSAECHQQCPFRPLHYWLRTNGMRVRKHSIQVYQNDSFQNSREKSILQNVWSQHRPLKAVNIVYRCDWQQHTTTRLTHSSSWVIYWDTYEWDRLWMALSGTSQWTLNGGDGPLCPQPPLSTLFSEEGKII